MVGPESNQQIQCSSSLKPSYVPKTLTNLLNNLAKIDNVEKKISILNDYLKKYEEELSRVEELRRDLPQCMLLLMDAIEIIKDEITKTTTKKVVYGDQDISVLYDHNYHINGLELQRRFSEFLTSKKGTYENDYRDDEMQMNNIIISNTIYKNNVSENKYICGGATSTEKGKANNFNGFSGFVPLTPYQDHLRTTDESYNRGKGIVEIDNKGKNKEDKDDEDGSMMSRNYKRMVAAAAAESEKKNGKRGGSDDGDEKMVKLKRSGSVIKEMNEMIHRGGVMLNQPEYQGGSGHQFQAEQHAVFLDATWKSTTRRIWTPHLHESFIKALNVLGGPEVATPKQIKEQMNVSDLTNDQVKSHLQVITITFF
ncbi:myb family transcription factor EFM-like [Humulus lupulus]|uniref:myb family transcription factor EFM-like n=1 Tax=Humulus lupulus TaxID=3486 RepID=UPI002B405C5C|nr:myb family transcription factor EFM-like [Humulus lupulus]